MQTPLVIYFEGLPGSGKTTLINKLTHDYPEFFQGVPEYIDPAEADRASQSKDQSYFLRNDEAKYRMARAGNRISLVDRGHLSTVLYSKAHELLKGHPLVDVESWYFGEILSRNMLPDLYVHLDTSPQTTFARRPKTTNWDNIWDYEAALNLARSSFVEYVREYEPHVPILSLDADAMTTEQMMKKFMKYIRGGSRHIKLNMQMPMEILTV